MEDIINVLEQFAPVFSARIIQKRMCIFDNIPLWRCRVSKIYVLEKRIDLASAVMLCYTGSGKEKQMYISMLMILTGSLGLAQSQNIPKWSVHEIKLNTSGNYENSYIEASVTAEFIGPDGVQKAVNGFWNSDDEFIIRFTPTALGKWTYKTSSSDAGMDGKTGVINCVASLEGSHGFLRRDADHPYHFVFDDGTRYFMFGNTYYGLMGRKTDEWKETIDGKL